MTVSNCMRLAASLTFSFMIASPYVTAHAYDGVLVAQVEDDDEEEVERDRVQIKPVMRSLSPSIRRLRPDPGSIKAAAKSQSPLKTKTKNVQRRKKQPSVARARQQALRGLGQIARSLQPTQAGVRGLR